MEAFAALVKQLYLGLAGTGTQAGLIPMNNGCEGCYSLHSWDVKLKEFPKCGHVLFLAPFWVCGDLWKQMSKETEQFAFSEIWLRSTFLMSVTHGLCLGCA